MVDIDGARALFPALERTAYFNTAAVALGNTRLQAAYSGFLEQWMADGFDFVQAEAAAEAARRIVARLLTVSAKDVALVPAVSLAAGLVAGQFLSGRPGENLVIGEREYSSNHFPWRQLEGRGFEVRQAPFRNGGIEPVEIERLVDGGTRLIAVSAVQTASGHRSDIGAMGAIARQVGAWLFVDGSQCVGALSMAEEIEQIDFLATPDHKFLLNGARGMGYLYIKPERQAGLVPINAGWKAGAVPFESFFGPDMTLSSTASRFDVPISWFAAVGEEICLRLMEEIGFTAIFQRNLKLAATLRGALAERGLACLDLPEANRSHIVSVPIGESDPAGLVAGLKRQGVVGSLRDRHLRLAPHFYNNDRDIARCVEAVAQCL